jgi:hypothetical protein
MKLIKAAAIWLYRWVMGGIADVKRDIAYAQRKRIRNKMIKLADSRAKATGKKQWLVVDDKGALIILRSEIMELKRYGKFRKEATAMDFDREALYVAQIDNRKRIKVDTTDYEERKGHNRD